MATPNELRSFVAKKPKRSAAQGMRDFSGGGKASFDEQVQRRVEQLLWSGFLATLPGGSAAHDSIGCGGECDGGWFHTDF